MIYLDLAIKSVVVSGLGWLAVSRLRKSSASTRHVALILTLIGVCVLPGAWVLLPQWHVPFISVKQAAVPSAATVAATVAGVAEAPSQPIDLLRILFGIWLVVAALLAFKICLRLLRLAYLERRLPMVADGTLQTVVSQICRKSGKHVLFLEGPAGEPPMMWGFRRPVLLLPESASGWPLDRVQSVVLHELAHVERKDWIASLFAQLACAIHWFNPIVWSLKKRLEIESETAADDRVLAMGVCPLSYATHLLDVTRELSQGLRSTEAAVAMARPGRLDHRVRSILEERRSRRTTRGFVSIALIATALAVGIVGAAEPTLVREALKVRPNLFLQGTRVPAAVPSEASTPAPKAAVKRPTHRAARHETPKSDALERSRPTQIVQPSATAKVVQQRPAPSNPKPSETKSVTRRHDPDKDDLDNDDLGLGEAATEVVKAGADASREIAKALKEAEEISKKNGVKISFDPSISRLPAQIVDSVAHGLKNPKAAPTSLQVKQKPDTLHPPPGKH
ncbi:MAG TPA: M56 family metallopeptidase [Fimbriimonas sp.]|nr:M56 family metallopeptidase [Fimbriimonas sp.]